jgi:hypothetical protein
MGQRISFSPTVGQDIVNRQIYQALASVPLLAGQPVYMETNGMLGKAIAADVVKSIVVGVCLEDKQGGELVNYQVENEFSLSDWTYIIGQPLLELGKAYYLDSIQGKMTTIKPMGTGALIGWAVDTNKLNLEITISDALDIILPDVIGEVNYQEIAV